MSSEPSAHFRILRPRLGGVFAQVLFWAGAGAYATQREAWRTLRTLSNWSVSGVVLFGLVVPWVALPIAAEKLGVWTSLTTGAVFYWPFLRGTAAALRAMARLDRDRQVALGRRSIALTMAQNRVPLDKDTIRRFEPPIGEVETTSASVVLRVALACAEGRYEPVALILALDMPKVRIGSVAVRKEQLQAVRLGILTTFIGLMVGLSEISPLLSGSGDKTAAIGRLVQDMATAFGGSVAGLCAAALLQILANRTEHLETQLLKEIEATILKIQSYFYGAVTKEPLIRSMDALSHLLSSFNTSFNEGRIQIDKAAESVGLQIRGQDELMLSRLEGLSQGRDAFGTLVQSQIRAIASLEDALQQASQRIASDIRTWVISEVQTAAASSLASSVAMGESALKDHAEAVGGALAETGRQQSQTLADHTRASLNRTDRTQRSMLWLLLGVSVVIAMASLIECGVILWVFVLR